MQGQPTLDVTVVVPLLDEEESLKELKKGIDTVLGELRFEVIFVDDGSQEDYGDIKSQFSDSRFKWLTISNQGVSAARNHGIAQATADYICLCDDDDYFCPEHIAIFSSAIGSP